MPAGREQRRDQQEEAGAERREQRARAGRTASSTQPSTRPATAERQRDAVGDDAVAQVDRADADERERQHERRDQLARRAEAPADRAAGDRARRAQRSAGQVTRSRPGRLLEQLAGAFRARDEPAARAAPRRARRARRRRRRARRRSRSFAPRRAAHDVERRLDARPAPERQGALAHEQLEAVDDRQARRQRRAAASGVGEPSAR